MPSSVRVLNLLAIEDWLKELRSPQWPSDFPPIDQAAAAKGKVLYQQNCVGCHVLIDRANAGGSNTAFMSDTGTDPLTYDNIHKRHGALAEARGGIRQRRQRHDAGEDPRDRRWADHGHE